MKRTVGLFALAVLAFSAFGQPPQAPSRVLFVPYETPTAFELWDPEEAEALGYTFQIVEPPRYGTLVGEPPLLTYVPNPKFYGTDRFRYLVQDPFGRFDIGMVQIVVLPALVLVERPVLAPNLSLASTVELSGMPLDLGLRFWEVGYFQRLGFFEQEVRAGWGPSGFSSLFSRTRVDLAIPGDPAVQLPIVATMAFDPNLPGLTSATVQSWANLFGVFAFVFVNYMGTAPETSTAVLSLRTGLGALSLEVRSTWKFIPLEFSELGVRLTGPAEALGCPACPFRFEGFLAFRKDAGFQELRLALLDLPFPCTLCDRLGLRWDLRVKFTPTSKTVEPMLWLRADWGLCVRPLVELVTLSPGWGFGGLLLYGMEIRCEFPDEQGVRLATSFVDDRNASVTGDARFFEVWQIYGPVLACCGPRGRWQLSTFFKRTGGGVFGWGMSEAQLVFPLSEQVNVRIIAKFGEVDPNNPAKTWALSFGFTGLW